MSNPTNLRPVQPVVANLLTGFAQKDAAFAGRNVFANRRADISGTIQGVSRGVFTDDDGEPTKSVAAGERRHAPIRLNPVTYECALYAHSSEVRAGALAMVDASQGVTGDGLVSITDRMVLNKHMLEEEAAVNTLMATTANWHANSATLAGNDVWTDPAANPIEQILDHVITLDGDAFNITLGIRSWQALMTNDKVKNGMGFAKDTQVAATPDVLAVVARNLTIAVGGGKRINRINVSSAKKTSAGAASSHIVSDLCFIAAVGSAEGQRNIAVSNMPAIRLWSPLAPLEIGPMARRSGEWVYDRWYDQENSCWRLRAKRRYVYKVLPEAPYSALVLLNCNGNY